MRKTALLLGSLLAAPGAARAGGIIVGEAGSQAMERGGAFVAKSDDPTALSVNPAGLMKSSGVEIYLGANLLNMSLDYQRAGTYPHHTIGEDPSYAGSPYPLVSNGSTFQPIPYLAASQRIGNLAIGEGIFAPPGVPNRDFSCEVADNCQVSENGAPLPNRYDIVKQDAIIAYPSLALAYRIHPRLDIGARASWGFGSVKARNFPWALPNPSENVRAEGDFETDVKDNFIFAWGAGALFRPTDSLEFGASYSSEKTVHARGTGNARLGDQVNPLGDPQVFIEPNPDQAGPDAPEVVNRCAAGGTVSALKTCINFKLPQTASLGGRFVVRDGKGGERGDVELDVHWENWSRASDDEILVNGRDTLLQNTLKPVIVRHGFRDTWSARLGGSYKIDLGKDALSLRGGFAYDTAAAPTSWTRTDKDGRARAMFGLGAAYDVGRRWRFDIGLGYVAEGSVTVADGSTLGAKANPPAYADRTQPDPLQPSKETYATDYHPINAGTYTSNYLIGSLGVTASF